MCWYKIVTFYFQLLGGAICAIGLWAWTEKEMFHKIGQLTSIPLDPALIFIIVGAVIFIIGFTGCVGALRENTMLLLVVSHTIVYKVAQWCNCPRWCSLNYGIVVTILMSPRLKKEKWY